MDLRVISKVMIKPSSQLIHHLQPFKLSFIDQLVPSTYFSLIFFYPATNTTESSHQISTQLKGSLSQTLSTFYPFSGRVKNNSFIDSYEDGVPCIETRVNGCLMDFLKQPQLELLNQFLPCQPFSNLSDQEAEIAQVNIQVNMFDCGGVAIGVCLSHKIFDASTASTFLNSWAANARGSTDETIINPDRVFEASLRFPPQDQSSVEPYLSIIENFIFDEGCKHVTKRFVFDAKAIATLRGRAKGEGLDNPSRIETLSSLIWKSCMEAAMFLSASARLSLSIHEVNIRHRIDPSFSRNSIGNIFSQGVATYDLPDENIKLSDLVALTRRAIKSINVDYLNDLQGDYGFQVSSNSLDQLKEIISSKHHEKLEFSSWLNFGFSELDFGWGKPIWVGVSGNSGPASTNSTIFIETGGNNDEIEAWMTLDESLMSILEHDPEFLKFASPNPSILRHDNMPNQGKVTE